MSESPRALGANGGSSDNESSSEVELECSICLSPVVHPVQLPCSHIFCFLCVKGSANRSKRCALCRQVIPPHFLFRPTLLKKEDLCRDSSCDDGHQWYYEGNRGWWQYDGRTSAELEAQFKAKCEKLEVLIAGFLYVVDFENMIQYRRNDPSRRRRIKRDSNDIPIKGVAGLKISTTSSEEGNRREGDGRLEEDRNQNQSRNVQSSRSLPSHVSSGRQSNGDDTTVGGPLSTDRIPVSSHSGRQIIEDQDRLNTSANGTHDAMTENVDESQTDKNRNRSQGTRLGAVGQGTTEDCLVQSSLDALSTNGQVSKDRKSTSDRNTDTYDLQEIQDGGGSRGHDRDQTEGDTDEGLGEGSSAASVTNVRSQEQGVDSPREVQPNRMQLRSRSGQSVKRQSPTL